MGYYQKIKFTTTDPNNASVKVFSSIKEKANALLASYISNGDIEISEDDIIDSERYVRVVYATEDIKNEFESELNALADDEGVNPIRDNILYEILEEGSA